MCVVSDKSMGITMDKRRCFLWTNWMTMEEDLLPIVWPNDSIMAHHCCHRCHHHVSQNSCWVSCLSHPLKVTPKSQSKKRKRKRSEELRMRLGPAARLSFHLTDLNKWMINQCENWRLKFNNNFNNDGQIPQNELKLKIKLQLRWIQERITQ